MVAIQYPTLPQGVDYEGIMGATQRGYNAGKDWRDEKNANAAFGQYISAIGGQQPQQTLGSLGGMFAPQQTANTVQRAPLPSSVDPATARVEQAFAAQGQGKLNSNAIAGRFLKTVRDGGVTNPYALAAIAATGAHESGFSPQNATRTWSDPSQSGQAGTSGGIMSWRGPRLAAMQNFARQQGDDPNAPSPETQAKFLLAEDPGLMQKLQQASSPEEAQQLMNNAWRFAGYDQQGGETAARIQSAQAYAPQFGGQEPSQKALEGLGVGQSAQPQQVADASGSFMPQVPQQAQQPASILPPTEVMQALFKAPATRPLAIGLAQAAIKLRANEADPQAQVEYQIAVEKLRQLRDPQSKLINAGGGQIYDPNTGEWIRSPADANSTPETGLQPQMMRNPETGETIYVQPTKDGRLLKSQVPDGFQPYDPYEKKYQEKLGGLNAESAANLPTDLATADQAITELDALINHPGLSSISGSIDQFRPSWTMGAEGKDALARFNQAKGRAFLQAFGMLKGGGQITEIEGVKAEQAMARMDRAQSEPEFKQALVEFRDAVAAGREKLIQRAGKANGDPQRQSGNGSRTASGVQWSIEE